MKKILIGSIGNFYKANFHSHSTISDGHLTPEEMVSAYKKHGYSILSITDHRIFKNHNDLTTDDFLLINGIEINIDKRDKFRTTYHLNLFAKDKNITKMFKYSLFYSVKNINKIIEEANKNNFFLQYNHPRWSHQYTEDFVSLKDFFSIEVFNGATELEHLSGRGDFEFETYCRINKHLKKFPLPSADDDNHNGHGSNDEDLCDSYLGFNMIEAKELTYESVIDSMDKGLMYASMAPYIYYLEQDNNIVHIKCSNVKEIVLLTDTRKRCTICDRKGLLDEATIEIPKEAIWYRIEILDKENLKAFTPVYRIK